jgi:hypothetical protein
LRPWLRALGAWFAICAASVGGVRSAAADPPPEPRIEARSASYLLVGLVHGESMTVHVSRLLDNSAVRDAQLTLLLRGREYPATSQVDGGYAVDAKDLALPGSAVLEFRVVQGGAAENLRATLQTPERGKEDDKSLIRQYAWWVLNFGVCIGALMLYSRRSKKSES